MIEMVELNVHLCGAEGESVVHMLWECSSYSTCRNTF